MIRQLDRILWRYKNKKTDALCEQLEKALRDEITRLVNNKQPLDRYLSELRTFCPQLLYDFDNKTDNALIQLREHHFESSLYEIREAEIALNGMSKIIEVWNQYESTKKEFEQLIKDLDLEKLRNLLTLKTLYSFFHKADKFLRNNTPRKALFVMRICQKEIEIFKINIVDKEEEKRILAKIDILCEHESITNSAQLKLNPFESLNQIRHLVRKGYFNLGEMLTDDVNMQLFAKQAQISYLDKIIVNPISLENLKNLDKVTQQANILDARLKSGFT